MMSQSDTTFDALTWSQIGDREYQLRADHRLLATLKTGDFHDSPAVGEMVGSCKWTFRRTGLVRVCVKVSADRDDACSATLVKSGADEYTVSFAGKSLQWKVTRDQPHQEWAFVDSDGTCLIVFVPAVTDSGYQASVTLATSWAMPDLVFLLLCGWYILISKYREDQFSSAILAAIPWCPA